MAQASRRVSVLCSLYRGGEFIEEYLDNITSQTIFREHCELIVIDANSPENEGETIERFARSFPQIVYRRLPFRAGIYAAWNAGVEISRGEYLTNANLDDLRRADSLEIQAATLDSLPFVDVVYQDFLYSFEPHLSFEDIAAVGVVSDLPIVTPHNLMRFNSPHNAPMWRRSVHDAIGLFDETYRSAGDYEFWVRACRAGKTFFKTNDPHVAYYVNPQGISTSGNTRGIEEARMISKRYWHTLSPPPAVEEMPDFSRRHLGKKAGSGLPDSVTRYDVIQSALRHATAEHERALNTGQAS